MLDLIWYFITQEMFQWIVALAVNFALFYYHVKIKGYQHHYWLFNFFPTILASMSPDFFTGIARILEYFFHKNFYSVFLHEFFATIFVSWIFIPFILLFVWLFAKTEKFKKPKDWMYYVITVSLISMIIHLYIMDPLGF